MTYPTGNTAVRPGSSDALTARTIDATVHPPLVRAQETVVALGPRIAESVAPFTSPVFLGLVGVTLIFVWVAHRMRYRPSAILLGGLLVAGLTSFRPMPKWEQPQVSQSKRIVDARRPRTRIQSRPQQYWDVTPQPTPMPDDRYQIVMPEMPQMPAMPRSPESDVSMEIMRRAEAMMRDAQVRQVMQELQYRLRQEARERRWRRIVARYKAHNPDFDPGDLVLTR